MSTIKINAAQQIAIDKVNNNIALTPWQKECEIIIIRRYQTRFTNDEAAAMLRCVYELANCMASRQHWAGDYYSKLLIDNAHELMDKLKAK